VNAVEACGSGLTLGFAVECDGTQVEAVEIVKNVEHVVHGGANGVI